MSHKRMETTMRFGLPWTVNRIHVGFFTVLYICSSPNKDYLYVEQVFENYVWYSNPHNVRTA